MAYQRTTWASGDTITSAKLNNIESGILGVESTIVNNRDEMADLFKNGAITKTTWVQGGVIAGNGQNTSATDGFVRTPYMRVYGKVFTHTFPAGAQEVRVVCYDANQTWISPTLVLTSSSVTPCMLNNGTEYVRICIVESGITPSSSDAVNYQFSIGTQLQSTLAEEATIHITDPAQLRYKIGVQLNTTQGASTYGQETGNLQYICMPDYIFAKAGSTIGVTNYTDYKFQVAAYTLSNGVYTCTAMKGISTASPYTVPSDCYVRFSIRNEPGANQSDDSLKHNLLLNIISERTSDAMPAVRTQALVNATAIEDIENLELDKYYLHTCVDKSKAKLHTGDKFIIFGDSIATMSWVSAFATATETTCINKAVGGAVFGENNSDRPQAKWVSTQVNGTTSAEWANAKLVIVAAGTNDAGWGIAPSEVKARVQEIITAIKAACSTAHIVFITPTKRGENGPSRRLAPIAGVIGHVAVKNGCSVINGFDFPIPPKDVDNLIDNMTADAVHPSAVGLEIYLRSVLSALEYVHDATVVETLSYLGIS